MVPVRLEGDPLEQAQYDKLVKDQHHELWVPKTHESAVLAYLQFLEKTDRPLPGLIEALKESNAAAAPASAEAEATAQNTKALLAALKSDPSAAAALVQLSQNLLKELYETKTAGAPAFAGTLAKSKAYADEVLVAAAAEQTFFAEAHTLRGIQNASEHSVFTGSVAAIVASALGKTDPPWLAGLISAATFHDLGMLDVPTAIAHKAPSLLTPLEKKTYEGHVAKSVRLLKDTGEKIPELVLRVVQEHHERADGSGFPQQKKEADIAEASKFLIVAHVLDDLCRGRNSGQALSPYDSFQRLWELQPAGPKITSQLKQSLGYTG